MTEAAEVDAFIAWARDAGWDVRMNAGETRVPAHIDARYREIPNAYRYFLGKVARLASPRGAGWFNCIPEFASTSDAAWRWNEWELMSYEWCLPQEQARLKAFWDTTFPIYLQVGRGDYEYYAIDMATGAVVYSHHEFWDEPEIVASSFPAFLALLTAGRLKWFCG